MPKKRKNGGKNRHNRGLVGFVRCDVSGRAVAKDKAIKRFIVRNLVDASGKKDLETQSVYNAYPIPKMYYKAYYSISAAIHQRIVRPRNKDERKKRAPPAEIQKKWAQQAARELKEQEEDLNRQEGGVEAGGDGGGAGQGFQRGFDARGASRGRGAGRGRGGGTRGISRGGGRGGARGSSRGGRGASRGGPRGGGWRTVRGGRARTRGGERGRGGMERGRGRGGGERGRGRGSSERGRGRGSGRGSGDRGRGRGGRGGSRGVSRGRGRARESGTA